jgi:hypothetical protein
LYVADVGVGRMVFWLLPEIRDVNCLIRKSRSFVAHRKISLFQWKFPGGKSQPGNFLLLPASKLRDFYKGTTAEVTNLKLGEILRRYSFNKIHLLHRRYCQS